LGKLVSEGRKQEFAAFGWEPEEVPDPQDEATFTRSRLRWDEIAEPEHAGVLAWYRELIALRRSVPDFVSGNVEVEFSEEAGWLKLRRGRLLVAFSIAPEPMRLPVERRAQLLLRSSDQVSLEADSLTLASDSVAVLRILT
jgi:maltooligosyltrehalose trehalohydrolase